MSDNCATVTFSDQKTADGRVVIDEVYLLDSGFVDLHDRPDGAEPGLPATDEDWKDWQVGPSGRFQLGYPLGVSAYLEPGTHEDVPITLFSDVKCIEWEGRDLSEARRIAAMAHKNTTDGRSFKHYCEPAEDDPYGPHDPSCTCPPDGERPNDVVEDCATVTPR